MKSICFVTTGDIMKIATTKRALGLAVPLADLGWNVSILMENATENHKRVEMECDERVQVHYFDNCSASAERQEKSRLLAQIHPSVVYICAFVYRNMVKTPKGCVRLVEHSELLSGIKKASFTYRLKSLMLEHYSIYYADGLLNASRYLNDIYTKRAPHVLRKGMKMLYFPYAYNKAVLPLHPSTAHLPLQKQENDRFFVFLGTLTANYGAFTMLEAFEQIHNKRPNYHLVLLGRGRHYDQVQEYIANHNLSGFVHSMGYIAEEDIAPYFSMADAFVSPMNDTVQDWARCPSKLYMYLPYKKPVLTCRIGEPMYTLGEQGSYYQSGDASSLAQLILSMPQNQSWSLGINPTIHEWTSRAKEMDQWITHEFGKRL